MAENTELFAEIGAPLLDEVQSVLLASADAASTRTLPLFRSRLAVENKKTIGFDPVTEADRGAEEAIRAVIADAFPDHAIIGEEGEDKRTGSDFAWIIDPIDGTRAFVSGVPVWGTLIGVTYKGRAIAGLMAQPFTGEIYLASHGRSELIHKGQTLPLFVRDTAALSKATLFTTTPALFSGLGQQAAFDAVESEVQLSRYGTDCYAYCLLASGHVDLVIEPRMNSYDIAALVPIIENAGGVVSTWDGGPAENGGDIIAAATPELRDAALAAMGPFLKRN